MKLKKQRQADAAKRRNHVQAIHKEDEQRAEAGRKRMARLQRRKVVAG